MAFFNFIETFFFISLGITFVLILLLVYHFKQRMTGLEQKCDTMFEIINDVVKELNVLRIQNTSQQQPTGFFQPMPKFMPQFNINDIINKNASMYDDAELVDSSDESSDVGNSDEDSEDENDDECFNVVETNENVVKIINVNQETLTELDVENLSITNEDAEHIDGEESDDDVDNDNDDEHPDDDDDDDQSVSEQLAETILVEKIEPIEEFETNVDPTDSKESDKEIYKKMSLGALKALVISKGLCSDAKTMRKPELLKLLEAE